MTTSTNSGNIISSKVIPCQSVNEVETLMGNQNWFYSGNSVSDGIVSLQGADLNAAKSIYIAHAEVFTKYPQLIGKLNPTKIAPLKGNVYANCFHHTGRGGITCNVDWFSDSVRFAKQYQFDISKKFHPEGTDWTSIVTHEFGKHFDYLMKGVT